MHTYEYCGNLCETMFDLKTRAIYIYMCVCAVCSSQTTSSLPELSHPLALLDYFLNPENLVIQPPNYRDMCACVKSATETIT